MHFQTGLNKAIYAFSVFNQLYGIIVKKVSVM